MTIGGEPGTGHWALAAEVATPGAIDAVTAEVGDFRWSRLADVWHEDFVPGAVKYGDIEKLTQLATE